MSSYRKKRRPPGTERTEQQTKQLLCKFAACTEDERVFLLKTVDCMVEQMLNQHHTDEQSCSQ